MMNSDSDGHCISKLEEILLTKKPKRTFWEKYICGCFTRKDKYNQRNNDY